MPSQPRIAPALTLDLEGEGMVARDEAAKPQRDRVASDFSDDLAQASFPARET